MSSNKTIRLRTTPGESQNIQFKIEQEFDTLDILSLKITQDEAYRNFCSDYGVVVGRVIANDGFGVENAKISVFIPITNEDQENPVISTLYPYTTVNDTDYQGVRYNLLPKQGKRYTHYQTFPSGFNPNSDQYNYQSPFKGEWVSASWILETTNEDGTNVYSREVLLTYGPTTPTGTFPSKQEFLDNDILLEVYEKYYKLTTKTNGSGDYMLFGVPVGNQTIHMDVDLSDAGQVSLTVDDFLNLGYPQQLFDTVNNKFLSSTNLDSLPQIESRDIGVEVVPFWGDLAQCEIGITRLDFNLNKVITPSAVLVFQAFTNQNGYIKTNCNVISEGISDEEWVSISNMIKLPVSVRYEPINSTQLIGNSLDFSNGNVFLTIPMYEEKYVTNEFGNYELSTDQNKGIATKSTSRIWIWGTNTHQKYLGIDSDYNTAKYFLNNVVTKYDLFNKKRQIYTIGNINKGIEDILTANGKWFSIKGDLYGNNLPYPINFKQIDGNKKFGEDQVCYGSLYFPVFQTKSTDDVNNSVCGFLVNYINEIEDESAPYYGFGYEGVSTTGSFLMNITDLIKLFKPFGGSRSISSSSLVNNQLVNDPQINALGIAGDSISESGINLANETIPLRNSLLGNINPVFPNLLNTDSTPYNNIIRTNSSIGPEFILSLTGRYFFYFGLKENDNALTYLKERLGE